MFERVDRHFYNVTLRLPPRSGACRSTRLHVLLKTSSNNGAGKSMFRGT
jgi:hypothetical protein